MPFARPVTSGKKMVSASSGGTPGPLSSTCRLADELCRVVPMLDVRGARVRSTMRPRSPTACSALRARFSSAWMIWFAVDLGIRQARVVVALDQHAGARFAAQQPVHVLAELVHVDQRLLRRARRAEHGVDQRGEPVGFADDDAGVFAQVLVQLALEQLRRAAQAAERILDLVRELPNHLAAAVEARHQLVLARDALALRGVGDFQQQVLALEFAVERRHRDVDDAMFAAQRAGHAPTSRARRAFRRSRARGA